MPRILAILAILSWGILLFPYPTTVFLASCTACLTLPLFENLKNRMKHLHSVLVYSLGMACLIIIPLTFIASLVAPQAITGLKLFQQWRSTGWEIPVQIQDELFKLQDFMSGIPGLNSWIADLSTNFSKVIDTIVTTVISGAVGLAGGALNFLWYSFLFSILTVLGVVYAQPIKIMTLRLINLEADSLDRFILSIRSALRSVVMGILFVAVIQGVLCGFGFLFFKVPEPIFWGLLATIVAPIPFIGTAMVWVPLSIMLWFTQSPGMAIGLATWGTVVVAGIDNFLRPYFLSAGINAPLFVLMLSIICGMAVFGAVGLIAGPVLVAFALQCTAESTRLLGIEVSLVKSPIEKKNRVLNKNKKSY